MAKALLTDGLLSVFPAADACPADLCMVGKLLTVPAFCLPVSAEEVSAAPVQKQGVVVQNVLHRDAVKGGELVRPGAQADPAAVRAGGSAAPDPTGNGTAAPDQQKLCLKARDPRTGTVAQRLASRITGRIKGAACGRRTYPLLQWDWVWYTGRNNWKANEGA